MTAASLPAFHLDGRVALITGAAGLLGPEHARALLAIGARVVLTDINLSALERVAGELRAEYPPELLVTLPVDVGDPASVAAAADALAARALPIDILVNNAAIDPKVTTTDSLLESSRLEHFEVAEWDRQLNVGLRGAFLCSQRFGAAMAERGRGVILNIASDLSVIAPDQRLYRKPNLPDDRQPVKPVTYSVIKAGLVGLTRYLATYWADRGVRANALSPGGVRSAQHEDFVLSLEQLIPMGRMARRDEYRGAVQFLCSDASSYLNGQNLVIDGGRSVL